MKITLCIIILFTACLLPQAGFAQYTGGEGDGYAMTSFQTQLSSAGEVVRTTEIKVYPNPAQAGTQLHIQNGEQTYTALQLLDISGRVWKEMPLTAGTTDVQLPLAGIPAGSYLLQVKLGDEWLRQPIFVY